MDVHVSNSEVRGTARAPPSKSYTHRAILAAGYADGAVVRDPLRSADTRATVGAVEAFGGDVTETDGDLHVTGFGGRPAVPDEVIRCANSGTTMRLATACAALADGLTVVTGDDSLRSRPQGPLLDAIRQLGGRAESTRANGKAPLVVGGPVDGGRVSIPGDVSSQFVTALLMAGAVTPEGVTIDLQTELKSAPYVDVTLEVLDAFGVEAERTGTGFSVPGGQSYTVGAASGGAARGPDGVYSVPGDFSSSSYLLAAGVVAADGELVVEGAHRSAQGDTAIVDVLERMGAEVAWDREAGRITVRQSSLSGVEVGVADTPDLLPTLATLGAVAGGTTRIVDCEHVRYKETDRVSAMADELGKLGAIVEESRDVLVVHGGQSTLDGATVDGRRDHRVIMALAVAGLAARGTTTIRGGEHVDVSFPHFFDLLYDLGAAVRRDEK